MKINRLDLLFIFGLILIVIIYSILFFDPFIHPIEDAAMIMRYAQNASDGYGIVWNIGEKPIDGATDFLFMVLLISFLKVGLPAEITVIGLGYFSHILTVILVYIVSRKIHGSSTWVASIAAIYLALGPGIGYVAAYFGTPFFGLFVGITWCFATMLAYKSEATWIIVAFALSGLITGLIRPEGVFLVLFMLAGVVYIKGLKSSQKVIMYFLGIFIIIGGIYFLWRWNYFGYPLPNPFYKKGGGSLYLSSLSQSIRNTVVMSLPLLPIFFFSLFTRFTRKQAIFSLIPVVGFSSIWILLSNEMNYLMRFQYATLIILSLSWAPLFKGLSKKWQFSGPLKLIGQRTWVIFAVLFSIVLLIYQPVLINHKQGNLRFREGTYDVAVMLSDYKDLDYTIATTEAGLLPYYSGWRAIDTWGLNDQWIAHNGQITSEYLRKNNPHIIVFHAYFSPLSPPENDKSPWATMVLTLKDYAETNNYYLAAVFGVKPNNTIYYYVRKDFPDSPDIIDKIENMDYSWYGTREKATNYVAPNKQFSATKVSTTKN